MILFLRRAKKLMASTRRIPLHRSRKSPLVAVALVHLLLVRFLTPKSVCTALKVSVKAIEVFSSLFQKVLINKQPAVYYELAYYVDLRHRHQQLR
jgi:hypothetical protein